MSKRAGNGDASTAGTGSGARERTRAAQPAPRPPNALPNRTDPPKPPETAADLRRLEIRMRVQALAMKMQQARGELLNAGAVRREMMGLLEQLREGLNSAPSRTISLSQGAGATLTKEQVTVVKVSVQEAIKEALTRALKRAEEESGDASPHTATRAASRKY